MLLSLHTCIQDQRFRIGLVYDVRPTLQHTHRLAQTDMFRSIMHAVLRRQHMMDAKSRTTRFATEFGVLICRLGTADAASICGPESPTAWVHAVASKVGT